MNKKYLKAALIALLICWFLVFSIDSMFTITWPNYYVQRVFIWTPTVLIGVYWLMFGGDGKGK